MSLFDRLRPKWKHSDPAVRASAVAHLHDQALLENIADDDPSEAVRIAAVKNLTDQAALARYASGPAPVALHAMERVTDGHHLVQIALHGQTRAAREMAVERIDDGVLLHRISVCDTDAWVRLKARLKSMEPDHTRDFLRHALDKLQITDVPASGTPEFRGSLLEICRALLCDRRFRINGGVDDNEINVATIHELSRPLQDKAQPMSGPAPAARTSARFVAFKRGETGEALEVSQAKSYYEIQVWRTGPDAFAGRVEEKQLGSVFPMPLRAVGATGSTSSTASTDSAGLYEKASA